ncbi:STAS domain-containing protein [Streptomyces sp. ISL-66]|uniref:STAS domain-containing protein n=1 Tax=Streptomyces sp. ISL-66 TaxID=2819186 RepID=UPI001BE67F45|nr:STAS domain-containing protein [Streptomyces sp. ISL-66]MBT2470105.1 STAS domain-containing protein [Streptomyces sp. ISL-66]
MTVRFEADGVCVVVCAGEFDMDTIGELAAVCHHDAAGAKLLVLDVVQVAFADSCFLSLLVRLRKTRELVLAGPVPEQLHRLLEISGVLDLFEVRTGYTSA